MTRLDNSALETRRVGVKMFFVRDVQPLVLEACRRQQIGFDQFAIRIGTTRAALVLVLKGHDPVSPNLLAALRDLVAAASGDSGAGVSSAA